MKDHAFILPAVLLILSLLMITLLPLQDSLILAVRTDSEKSLSRQASNQAAGIALAEAFFFAAAVNTAVLYKCFMNTARINRVSIERSFCSSFYSPGPSLLKAPILDTARTVGANNLPGLDYRKILPNSNDCVSAGGKIISPFSIALSSRSALSNNFCQLKDSQISDSRTIKSNLKISQVTTLGGSSALSASGFLQSTSTIILAGSSHMIAAAGDLLLTNITASQAAELTLISASGDVKLLDISGPVQLRVFAAGEATLPAKTQFMDRGFEDLNLDFLPIGFIK